MADWRRLAKAVLLAGGGIEQRKDALLRNEVCAPKSPQPTDVPYLFEAKRGAYKAVPAFTTLLNEAIRTTILADGAISANEVAWLRDYILADGQVDEDEKKLLKELKLLADRVCPEFLALYNECM